MSDDYINSLQQNDVKSDKGLYSNPSTNDDKSMKSITHSGDVDSSFDKVNPEFKEGYTISLNAIEVEDEKNDTYLVTFFVYTNSTIGHLLEFKNIKKGTPRNIGNFKNSPVFLNIYIQKNQNRNVSIKYGSKTTLLSVGKDELKF